MSVEVEVRPVKICRAYHFFKEHTNTGILDHKILSWHAVSLELVITGIWKLSVNYEKQPKMIIAPPPHHQALKQQALFRHLPNTDGSVGLTDTEV